MAAQKPGIPSGTRDFSHEEMIRRTYIFDTIRRVFQTCGFMPIETPAMENLTTLMGKYGEEGDKLLFKVLNSGDFMSKVPAGEVDSLRMAAMISEKGLRYDLTVPFARYVVQHQGELTFPFKRYQIQPVWRADRPQKGRYREFYQCDVDVIGSKSLINEVELIGIVEKVFEALKVGVKLKLNNRKILFGIAQTIGHDEKMTDITTAIDKLEKIGIAKVNEELAAKGIDRAALDTLQPILSLSGTNREKLEQLESVLAGSETGMKGICEMRAIFDYTDALGIRLDMELDLSLARGLNYYTGAIFEVKALDFEIGSICGGGRYDDLTGIFGLPDMSGVGISFGADRIYDVLSGLNLFPADTAATTGAMFLNFGGEAELTSLRLLRTLRESGVSSEIYPENAKIKKQMDYANKKNIPFVIIIGDNELEAQSATLKNMNSGEQTSVAFKELAGYFV